MWSKFLGGARAVKFFTNPSLVGAFGGALFGLLSPPMSLLPCGIVGYGLLTMAWLSPRNRVGFLPGFFFGTMANLVGLRFVPAVIVRFTPLGLSGGLLALLLVSAFQGIGFGVASLVASRSAKRLSLPAPLAAAVGTAVASYVPGIFPWSLAGAFAEWPLLVQSAELVGDRGVSALAAALLTAVAMAFRTRPFHPRRLGLPGTALVLLLAWGVWRMQAFEGNRGPVSVALVNPMVDATLRWEESAAARIRARLQKLTASAEAAGAELVIWPEAAHPYRLREGATRDLPFERSMRAENLRGPILVGVLERTEDGDTYNSALVARPDGSLSSAQRKRHLLLFGEEIPFARSVPWLKEVFARAGSMRSGDGVVLLESGPVRALVLNCFEDTLSEVPEGALGANLLVNVTNDAWFVGTPESDLHLRLSRLRAIEQRKDLVRAVNHGVTSYVDARGVVVLRYEKEEPGHLLVRPNLHSGATVFSRFGDAPLLMGLVFACLAHGFVGRQKSKGRPDLPGTLSAF